MIDPGLSSKIVLVTGGNSSRGIGAATARAFARQGAAVFVHYFRSTLPPEPEHGPAGETAPAPGSGGQTMPAGEAEPVPRSGDQVTQAGEGHYQLLQQETAEALVAEIRAAGGRAEAWEADLADPLSAASLFDRAEATLGPVDVLVNNAAYCQPDTLLPPEMIGSDSRAVDGFPMRTLTAASLDRHLAVNARAPALLMAELARRHHARAARWGRIVNVSTDGARGFPTEVSYGSSKLALESLSRAAAHELGPLGITVNVVSLGPIQTGWITPDLEAAVVAQTPLRRVGRPDDVADAIVFLASEQARWITGQVLRVGGGHTI
jgi:3-oxoacyl-[acyl-carrier protein] reductase